MELLGADFDRLGPLLQIAHGPDASVHARGQVAVTHGQGRLVRILNRLNGVPAAGPNVPLKLEIQRTSTDEVWIRDFGNQRLTTRQWAQNGLFVEAAGPVRLEMRLRLEDDYLLFEPVNARFLGIKMPARVGVSVFAKVREMGNGWEVFVETRSAILGLLFRYEGHIEIV